MQIRHHPGMGYGGVLEKPILADRGEVGAFTKSKQADHLRDEGWRET